MGVVGTRIRSGEVVISPANQQQTQQTELDNLTVLTTEVTTDVYQRVEETAFNDAAVVQNNESTTPASQFDSINELSSIIAFLKRPTLMWQSKILASSPALVPVSSQEGTTPVQTPLKTFYFPHDLMVLGNKFDKIKNFEWFKTDIRLRVLINANPFIAGRLFITYAPNDNTESGYTNVDRKGRVGVTSYPGVELDLQTNTASEIIIPWIAKPDAEQAKPSSQNLFRVDIWQLCPLLSSDNSLSIPIQVYASFENIDLQIPTPLDNTSTYRVERQGKEAKGIIGKVASGIGKITGAAKNIPIVGTYAAQAEWASDIVGSVANVFGWSRPVEGSHAPPLSHIPGRGFCQFTAKDNAVILAMSNDNEIAETENNLISTADEMSVEHVCSRPGLVDVIDWNVKQDYNDTLGVYNASPFVQAPNSRVIVTATEPVRSFNVFDHSLAEYVIQGFQMHRADWVYRISLVKTAFHVGRFEVFFIPNRSRDWNAMPDYNAIDTTNCYRQIFDITEQSEMTFEIPYVHKYNMLQNLETALTNVNDPCVGQLVIRVVSPLTCPETVSQSIKILVWKHAKNVALSWPKPNAFTPLQYANLTSTKVERQIDVKNAVKDTHYCVLDKDHKMEDNLDATKLVSGEMCINLRNSTRAFRRTRATAEKLDARTRLLPNIVRYNIGGYLGYWSNIYYFYRGGIAYKTISTSNSGIVTYSGQYDDEIRNYGEGPFHYTPPNNPVNEVQVPFYSQTRREVCNQTASQGFQNVLASLPYVIVKKYAGEFTTDDEPLVMIAAKDDFTFGFLIGSPQLIPAGFSTDPLP